METLDLRECPIRYEIHIKKDHFNYVFGIAKCTQLNANILVAEPLPIEYAPDGGVYASVEDAIAAALIVLKRIAPDANVEIEVDSNNE